MSFTNERAACWACTAWLQLVLSVVLPTALLLGGRKHYRPHGRQAASLHPPDQESARAGAAESSVDAAGAPAAVAGRPTGTLHRLLAWLDEAFCEEPLLVSLYAAEAVWVLLRAACGLRLER